MSNIPPQDPQNQNPLDPAHTDGPRQEEWMEEGARGERTPITKQPLFWIALVAAIASLLALGYLLGQDDGENDTPTTSVVVVDATTEVITPGDEEPAVTATETATATQTVIEQQPAPAPAPPVDEETDSPDEAAQLNEAALGEADALLAADPYSKQALFDLLTSQEGGAYPQEAAQYAVENIGVDWNGEALRAAEKIRENNPEATADDIFSSLTDDNEWAFTEEEAQFAVDSIS